MLKTRIILVVVSIALIAGLFMLPKVVVENDNTITETPGDSISRQVDLHAKAPEEIIAAIKNLRSDFSADSKNEKNAIFADSLANLYALAGKFDSAAWFSEEASKFFNTTDSWIKAGDHYYQAYSFALDGSKQSMFAERARSLYNKVLAQNPNNLDVKTKLAMTFLTDASPMQAITMLRAKYLPKIRKMNWPSLTWACFLYRVVSMPGQWRDFSSLLKSILTIRRGIFCLA
jgi:outer membrane protein